MRRTLPPSQRDGGPEEDLVSSFSVAEEQAEELTELELRPELARIGRLLSNEDGCPTPAYWCFFLYLAGYPAYVCLVGWGAPYISMPTYVAAGLTGPAVSVFLQASGLALVGTGSLASLRRVSRPGDGFLKQLGAGSTRVPRSTSERFRAIAKVLAAIWALQMTTIFVRVTCVTPPTRSTRMPRARQSHTIGAAVGRRRRVSQ